MIEKCLFGEPVYFKGKYQEDKVYDLYVQMIRCSFTLKKDKIPTIQIKNNRFFNGNEYLTSSKNEDGDRVVLTLTNIDLKLFFEQYDVDEETLEYIGGYKFRSIRGLFTKYIDKWIGEKIKAGKEKNKGKRSVAKALLNSLYGKFAKCLVVRCKSPYLKDGIVKYKMQDEEDSRGIYLPVRNFHNKLCKRSDNPYKSKNKRLFFKKIWN